MKIPITVTLPLLALTHLSQSQAVFIFHDGNDSLGNTGAAFTGSEGQTQTTVDGMTLTSEAFIDGVSTGTDLYGTNSGSFGVDNPDTNSSGNDDNDRIDNLGGLESMVFSFNSAGTFQSIDLRFVEETANEAQLIFDGGSSYELNSTTALSGEDDFAINESFSAGQLITLQLSGSAAAGENFSLESVTVVPEPATFALATGTLMISLVLLKRR
ncbi:hypothetical protein DDZ13_10680 [Coraliomargarita sinensis]|uniref:PEP-CTERM protein-sorting domain-containing protein n=1 Tax=Coraliomargarita sinensis TaxID=2174842 RepID=A0A317ZK68_9BACT|nr:hypothetical protein [Coraliomargarita sinensis]PXA03751.1 hypothetical protein DDZ13_10680 [Coraliomargarita sinensis]